MKKPDWKSSSGRRSREGAGVNTKIARQESHAVRERTRESGNERLTEGDPNKLSPKKILMR